MHSVILSILIHRIHKRVLTFTSCLTPSSFLDSKVRKSVFWREYPAEGKEERKDWKVKKAQFVEMKEGRTKGMIGKEGRG